MSPPALEVSGLTIRNDAGPLLSRITIALPAGGRYVLLGRGDGPRELLRCAVGERRPDAGELTIGGWSPRRARRKLGSGLLALDGTAPAAEQHLDSFDFAVAANPSAATAARLARGRGTVLIASEQPEVAEVVPGARVGILRRDRLLADGRVGDLVTRFRRIRYVNRLTESRTAFGTELDEFEAVRVRVRGWGIEGVIADFREDAFARFREMDGVEDACADPMTLAEIVEAVFGD